MRKYYAVLTTFFFFAFGCTAPKPTTITNGDGESQIIYQVDISSGVIGTRLNDHLQQLQSKGYSGAVIVEIKNEIILKAGYGYSNKENKIPFSARTISALASLTKQFTAAAIVSLSQKGYFKLQDSLGLFFPQLSTPQSRITVDQVLTHSAGLSEYIGPDYKELSKEKFLQKVGSQKLEFNPGKQYLYSNTGYGVLALIIEKVTKKDFEEVVSEMFFRPSRINIGFDLLDVKTADFASTYRKGRNEGSGYLRVKELKGNFWALKGNAGFYGSAEEMYKWHKFLQNDSLISLSLKAAMYYPRFKRSENLFYGYGWNVRTNKGGEVNQISHGGSDDIMSCYWMELPKDNIWIYISSNISEFKATSIALEILNIIRKAP